MNKHKMQNNDWFFEQSLSLHKVGAISNVCLIAPSSTGCIISNG